jgi:ADP-ribosyl-[dinitrogen reductase] hydrolase
MELTSAQLDRAAGVLLGTASGDALGAGYEFGPPLADGTPVTMDGGGAFAWEPGEWTDDTSMAIVIARETAAGEGLDNEATLDRITGEWIRWAQTAPDVGNQLRAVLGASRSYASADVAAAAQTYWKRNGQAGGNGSLMRTAPVALSYLGDAEGLAIAARRVSDLTHPEPDAGDACVLWCLAIRHAVLSGEYDLRAGLAALPDDRRQLWSDRITEAETLQPRDFTKNGWVVHALQGAWSAIVHGDGFVDSFERAVRGGRDTDTVAAIAGGLLGARWGASVVPPQWQRILHGWPGMRSRDLFNLAIHIVTGARDDESGWPGAEFFDYSSFGDLSTLVKHPHDDGIWLGGVGTLETADVDAVVSLCRIGTAQAHVAPENHVEVWLVDRNDPASNPNLDLVLRSAVDAVAAFRAERKTVLLHCVQAQSRTPSVAALYSTRHLGVPIEKALADVTAALPAAHPKQFLIEAVARLGR